MAGEVVSLAERLKDRRRQLGLSQAQAARELDVARTAYRLWEMEAAKPSPDRWRLLAHWLGISVTALLLAEDIVSEDEATTSGAAETAFAASGRDWDAVGSTLGGDFFEQGRALVADGLGSGHITPDQASELAAVLDRLEQERRRQPTVAWQSASLQKVLPADEHAPRAAREAVAFVASGIPKDELETAQLLTSELVTNSVVHGPPTAIDVQIEVATESLHVTVVDSAGGAPDLAPSGSEASYGLAIVDALADRWGTQRTGRRNVTWFELQLPPPGGHTPG